MSDQADKLRRMVSTAVIEPGEDRARVPLVVVAGARNGVGATTVAVNLAAAIADRGERVLVLDAARHENGLAELAGISGEIEHSVADVIAGKCDMGDAFVEGPLGIRVLANRRRMAATRVREARRSGSADFSRYDHQRLLGGLESLRTAVDLVIVDVGPGVTPWTRRFWMRGQVVALVTTPDDAAVVDAYAAIKQSATDSPRPDVRVLVNQASSDGEADEVARRIVAATKRFLSLSVESLPAVARLDDDTIAGADCVPRVWEMPQSQFARSMLWLARAVGDVLGASRMQDAGGRGQGKAREAALAL